MFLCFHWNVVKIFALYVSILGRLRNWMLFVLIKICCIIASFETFLLILHKYYAIFLHFGWNLVCFPVFLGLQYDHECRCLAQKKLKWFNCCAFIKIWDGKKKLWNDILKWLNGNKLAIKFGCQRTSDFEEVSTQKWDWQSWALLSRP